MQQESIKIVLLLFILKHGVLLEEEGGDGDVLVIRIIAFIYALCKHSRFLLLKYGMQQILSDQWSCFVPCSSWHISSDCS